MRLFKLKAYVKKWNKILPVRSTAFADEGNLTFIALRQDNGSTDFITVQPGDEIELVDWTGNKDRNGKEIYEGDILQRSIEIYHGDKLVGQRQYAVGVVEYIADGCIAAFRVKYLYGDGGFHYQDGSFVGWDELEVIGNKFETPELLERADEQKTKV